MSPSRWRADDSGGGVRSVFAAGGALTGIMLQEVREDFIVRLAASSGFDFVIVDMEHGTYDLRDVERLAQLARLSGLGILVRPPALDYPWIARPLDAGADGIMAPRIGSRADVERVVSAMKYPPAGTRGMASQRAHTDYLPARDRLELARRLNQATLLVAQIELAEALDSLGEILTAPGLDAVIVGPSDLAVSLAAARGAPELDEAIDAVARAGLERGVPTGIQTSDPHALERWRRRGMQLLVLGTDLALISAAMRSSATALRDLVDGGSTS